MRIALILLALAPLAGCSSPRTNPPEAYARFGDRVRASLGLGWLLGYPCVLSSETKDGVIDEKVLPQDQCYRFNPREEIQGIWRDEFEGSALYGLNEPIKDRELKDRIWLDIDDKLPRNWASEGKLYRVSFIGRRTTVAGYYGHMGGSAHLVIVDKLEKIEPLAR